MSDQQSFAHHTALFWRQLTRLGVKRADKISRQGAHAARAVNPP